MGRALGSGYWRAVADPGLRACMCVCVPLGTVRVSCFVFLYACYIHRVCVYITPLPVLCVCTVAHTKHQTHLWVCVCVSWRGPVVCRRGSDRRSRVVGLPLWNVRWHVTTGCMSPISLTGGPHGPPARSRTVWRRGHGPVTCVPSSRQGMPGSRDWNVRRYVLPFPFSFSLFFSNIRLLCCVKTHNCLASAPAGDRKLFILCVCPYVD